jgi:molybdopterin converting factor small subunit
MPPININFIGPWRILLGARTVTVNVGSIEEARDYVENNFGPAFEKKFRSGGGHKKRSIWENSNILLNGTNVKTVKMITLKEGDRLDVLPKVAGG